ncbi:uncharacterized protein LOC112985140 [Dromaius novaehollandiae]|uniref:uncharacterized protein LOC112985140 n=1 Tax=Dromaius novaehollandiae TaxID=8790 RepID=UPI00311F01C8
MHLRDEVGYSDYEQKNQPFQEKQEDKQTKATGPQAPLLKEPRGKNTYTWFSKKKVVAREKVAELNDFALLDENIKRVTKHFCDWITTLGGGNCSIDEDALMKLFSASCESKATLPTLFHVVQLNNMQAEQPKGQELSPPWATGRSCHHISHRPCYVKEMEISQLHSTHAFKEFLERKGYRKPQFLLRMLAGGDGAHEETSKACK